MNDWTHNALWQKAKLFARRALDEDREGSLFPFWAILALEMLARAVLAKVHPVLLADPQDGENILFALGYGTPKNPRSIPAKTVFLRCVVIVPSFTEDEYKKCMLWMDLRNREVHTGALPLDGYPTGAWLAEYYRIADILLKHIHRSLIGFLGKDEARAAGRMIREAKDAKIGVVKKAIHDAEVAFNRLTEEDKQAAQTEGANRAYEAVGAAQGKLVDCPVCEAKASLLGEHIRAGAPQIEGEAIVRQLVLLPVHYECYSCKLKLEGNGSIEIASQHDERFTALGGQFNVEERELAEEFYDLDSRYLEDYWEYQNE